MTHAEAAEFTFGMLLAAGAAVILIVGRVIVLAGRVFRRRRDRDEEKSHS